MENGGPRPASPAPHFVADGLGRRDLGLRATLAGVASLLGSGAGAPERPGASSPAEPGEGAEPEGAARVGEATLPPPEPARTTLDLLVKLPDPRELAGGARAAALLDVLASRRSRREFGRRELTAAEVGALLWAGQGITSPQGGRTAPSAGALYPITLSLVDARAVWRYVPAQHALSRAAEGDRRARLAAAAVGQEAVAHAPVTVAVTARPAVLSGRYGRRAERYCALEAGHVAQNVLLVAAAQDLAAVPVGAFDDQAVRAVLGLGAGHLPLYLLPVGAPPGRGGHAGA